MSRAHDLHRLPDSWAWSRLVEVCDKIQDGTHFSPPLEQQFANGQFPYVTAKNIRPSGLDLSDITYISEERHRQIYERCDAAPGDVLLVKDGVNTGDAAINTYDGEISLLSSVCMLRTNSQLLTNTFLRYFLLSPQGARLLKREMTGTAIKRIILRKVRDTPAPIAPPSEQRRITGAIDALLSDLDAGVAALKRAQANLKRYRAAVLKAAVEGKLTEEWRAKNPPKETGADLLKRILKERRRKWEEDRLAAFAAAGKVPPKNWQARCIDPEQPDAAELRGLPPGWCWATVDQLIQRAEYGTSVKCDPDASGDPVLRIPNIAKGRISLEDMKFATAPIGLSERDALHSGDLLMCRTNGSVNLIGKSEVVRHAFERPHSFASYLLRFRFVEKDIVPYWVDAFLSSPFGRLFIESNAASSAGQHNVSLSLINRMPIPLPPLDEQTRVMASVEELLARSELIAQECSRSIELARSLRQSILNHAFDGKLVPQDPADEPAAELLARIQKERESARPSRAARGDVRTPAKVPREIFLRRAAVVSYTVLRLAKHPSFGRTQLEKVLHLAQSHLGVDLRLQFERYPAGPFDKSIYRLEGAARKNGWFTKQERKARGVTYHPGPKIETMCERAIGELGAKKADFDRLLDHIAKMDTDQAELFSTAYAAWNDLLIDGRPADDRSIIAELHGWDESKKKFTRDRIVACLGWMRQHGYNPTGKGLRTAAIEKSERQRSGSQKKRLKKRGG